MDINKVIFNTEPASLMVMKAETALQADSPKGKLRLRKDAESKYVCKCIIKETTPDVSLVVPWSNIIELYWRCNKCGRLYYGYNLPQDIHMKILEAAMKKAAFDIDEKKDLSSEVGRFLKLLLKSKKEVVR